MHAFARWLPACALLASVACAPATSAPGPAAGQASTAPNRPVAPAAAQAAAPPELVTINYAHPVISSQYLHLYVGQELGFYAAEGINLERVFVSQGNPAIAQGTVGGAYELASQSGDVLVQSVEQGAPLVAVAGENRRAVFGIIAQPEITSWADFRGKALTLGAASVRGGTSTVLRWILRQQGLQEGPDFSFVAAGSTSERVSALRNRVIAAGLMGQPQDFMMQDEGFRLLGYTTEYLPEYAMANVGARRDWAEQNAELVVRFLRAHIRSIHWLYDPANRAEAIRLIQEATRTEPQYAERSYALQVEQLQMWPPNGEMVPSALEATIRVLVDEGKLAAATPASKYIDSRYWEQAVAAVGRR